MTVKKKASKKKAVAIAEEIKLPAYMASAGNQGNENIDASDVALPRLNLLQALSPEATKNNPKFVEGAEPGMFINSVTKELFDSVNVINIYYNREWPIFRKRESGGGYLGKHNTSEEAREFIENHPESNVLEAVETANHYCLLVSDKGVVLDKVLFGLTSTKLRFSRAWNSLIVGKEGARFSYIWTINSISESNKKGTWASPAITTKAVIAPQAAFEEAERVYKGLMTTLASSK